MEGKHHTVTPMFCNVHVGALHVCSPNKMTATNGPFVQNINTAIPVPFLKYITIIFRKDLFMVI